MRYFTFILFTIILLFQPFSQSKAQRDFRSGYIITLQNDTVHGFILHTGVKKVSNECVFKKEETGSIVKYRPFDITGFRFDEGKYYISKELPLREGTKTFFTEYLIRGKANIYYCWDNDDHYFIEIEEGKLYELTEPVRIIESETDLPYYAPLLYKPKLKALMKDAKNIDKEINNTNLTHSSLIKLSKEYHEEVCNSEQCIVFERTLKKLKFNYGFDASTALSKLYFGNDLESNFSTIISAGAHISLSPILFSDEKLNLQLDVVFQKYLGNYSLVSKTDGYTYVIYNDINYYINKEENRQIFTNYYKVKKLDVDMNIVAIKFPLSFNYTFLISRLRPYVGIGFSNMIIISQNKNFIYPNTYDECEKSIPTFFIGGIGNIGLKYRLTEDNDLYFGCSYEQLFTSNANKSCRLIDEQINFKIGYNF